ncbi:hypothetical protein [Kaistia sp. 32K]
MSINDCPETREIFGRFRLEEATVTYSVAGHAGQKKGQSELIVSN